MKTMSQTEYTEFCETVKYLKNKHPEYKEGVVLFNALYLINTDLADRVPREINCFYNDAYIELFLDFVCDCILMETTC